MEYNMEIRKVAESDGKCFDCGEFCMTCECWLKGISDPFNISKQPERSKREDSVLNDIPKWGSLSSLNFEEWQRRCGALNSMET